MNSNDYAAQSILSPNAATRRDAEGNFVVLVPTVRAHGKVSLPDFLDLAEEGAITLRSDETTNLQSQYGRTRIAYSVN